MFSHLKNKKNKIPKSKIIEDVKKVTGKKKPKGQPKPISKELSKSPPAPLTPLAEPIQVTPAETSTTTQKPAETSSQENGGNKKKGGKKKGGNKEIKEIANEQAKKEPVTRGKIPKEQVKDHAKHLHDLKVAAKKGKKPPEDPPGFGEIPKETVQEDATNHQKDVMESRKDQPKGKDGKKPKPKPKPNPNESEEEAAEEESKDSSNKEFQKLAHEQALKDRGNREEAKEHGRKYADEALNRKMEGLTREERRAYEEGTNKRIDREIQGAERRLLGQQGRKGQMGHAATAQQRDVQRLGQEAKQEYGRDLDLLDAEQRNKKRMAALALELNEAGLYGLDAQKAMDDLLLNEEQKRAKNQQKMANSTFKRI